MFPREFIQEFADTVPAGGLVLDAGSGPGRDAELLRDSGLNLICLDASGAMVELTQQKSFVSVEGDLLDLPFADGHFSGLWTYTSLIHLPREQIGQALSELVRVLSPQGALGLGVIEGEDNEVLMSTDLVQAPRLFTYFTLPELLNLLQPYFEITYSRSMQPNRKKYLHIVAKKR